MMSKRLPLALVLSAVLFVTASFAASKKFDGDNRSSDWSNSPFRSASLLNLGSSVSSGSSASQSSGARGTSGSFLVLGSPGTPDNWNGGTGNWSVPGNWSAGLPGSNSDVVINTGNDDVNLDTDPVSINTLTLGDISGTLMSSKLEGGVAGGMFTIAGALTVNKTGYLFLNYEIGEAASLGNSGSFNLHGGEFTINGEVNNSGSIALIHSDLTAQSLTNNGGFGLIMGGSTLTVSGMLTNNAGGSLSIGGTKAMVTTGSVDNSGTIDLENASKLKVNGDVDNIANLYTSFDGGSGGNTLTITGTLNNHATGAGAGLFVLYGPGDKATIGNVVNLGGLGAGFIDLENGSSLTVKGNVANGIDQEDGEIYMGHFGGSGGNTLTIKGILSQGHNSTFQMLGPGDKATIGSVDAIGGVFDLENGSTLRVKGDWNNLASPITTGGSGGNTLAINGRLTNDSGSLMLYGPGDKAKIGSVVNSDFGTIDLENGSKLRVNGDVTNNSGGTIATSLHGGSGANKITINGKLTNSGTFGLYSFSLSDVATIGSVENSGTINVGVGGGLNEQLKILAGLNNNGDIFSQESSSITVGGNVSNTGLIHLETASTLSIGGNLTNSGTLETGTAVSVNVAGDLTNSGSISLDYGYPNPALTVGGNLINSGHFESQAGPVQVNGAATNSGFLESGYSMTVHGLLTNTATGQINSEAGGVLEALGGLSNSGVINVNSGSAIDPPFLNNLGMINIDGTSRLVVGTGSPMGTGYIQLANGTLGEMISATNFGVINVKGSALLDGTLSILLQGGYDPAVGSMYKFLLANPGQINGTFASILNDIFNGGTEKWLVTYDNADGFVELTAEANNVPEPATLLVLIPGLLGMAYGLRRRRLG